MAARVYLAVSLAAVLPLTAAKAEQSRSENPETGLVGWTLKRGGMQLELIQRLPDQTRAFFLARGFPVDVADTIGTSCVFQTIVRNTAREAGAKAVTVSLPDWQIRYEGHLRRVKLKEQWEREWPDDRVTPAARLAFRWATFPTEQTFEPGGDYNWGMISFDLPPGAVFDLNVRWQLAGEDYDTWMQGIVCAPDR